MVDPVGSVMEEGLVKTDLYRRKRRTPYLGFMQVELWLL